MLILILCIIALFIGIKSFLSKNSKYLVVVIIYLLLINQYDEYLSLQNNPIIKLSDFVLIFIAFSFFVDRKLIDFKNKFDKFILLFSLIIFVLFLFTLLMKYETFGYAVQDARTLFLYLLYFPLKRLNSEDVKKSLKIILKIEVCLGIIFLLQYAGIFLLRGYDSLPIEDGNLVRFTNIPRYFLFFLIYFFVTTKTIKFKIVYIFLFLLFLILPMSRMRVVFTGAVLLFYFIFINKNKFAIVKISLPIMLAVLLSFPFLVERIQSDDTSTDKKALIESITNYSSFHDDFSKESTFNFRLAMLAERVDFIFKHPKYWLTGVGFRHEESPKCYKEFQFILGTLSENLPNNKEEIHSVDINWVRIVTQMGLTGIILYLVLICKINILLYKHQADDICRAGFLVVLVYSFGSISESVWTENYAFIALLCLLSSYAYNLQNEKNN